MKIYNTLEKQISPTAVALGYFDDFWAEEIDIPDSISFVYSKDNQIWSDYVGQVVDLNKGEKVYFKATTMNDNLAIWNEDFDDYGYFAFFKMTGGKVAASGNLNTLLNPDPEAEVSLEGKDHCFY